MEKVNDRVVKRLEFNIQLDNPASFDHLSSTLADLALNDLAEIIDENLEHILDIRSFQIIDQLVLDLGFLNILNLRTELKDKFRLKFIEAILANKSNLPLSNIPDQETPFFLFFFYVQNGIKPWWLSNSGFKLQDFAEKAFRQNPIQFLNGISFYVDNGDKQKRILNSLSIFFLVRVFEFSIKNNPNPSKLFLAKSLKNFNWDELNETSEPLIFSALKKLIFSSLTDSSAVNTNQDIELKIIDQLENSFKNKSKNLITNKVEFGVRKSHWGLKKVKENRNPDLVFLESYLEELQLFGFFLMYGHYPNLHSIKRLYHFQNINSLFNHLLEHNFLELVDILLKLGNSSPIKRRFLSSVSEELIFDFFTKVAPSKKKLLEWVVDVYQKVQEEFKPINQTFIRVRNSINEITFDLFLSKKIDSIKDENYIRHLFKLNARKFGIRYKELLIITLRTLDKRKKSAQRTGFHQLVWEIFKKDFSQEFAPLNLFQSELDISSFQASNSSLLTFKNLPPESFNYASSQIWGKKRSSHFHNWMNQIQSLKIESLGGKARVENRYFELLTEYCRAEKLEPKVYIFTILLQIHKIPNSKIFKEDFVRIVRKYKIPGVFFGKNPNGIKIIDYLKVNHTHFPRALIKAILSSINYSRIIHQVKVEDFFKLLYNKRTNKLFDLYNYTIDLVYKIKLNSLNKIKLWWIEQLLFSPKSQLNNETIGLKFTERFGDEFGLNDSHSGTTKNGIFNIYLSKQLPHHTFSKDKFQKQEKEYYRFFELIGWEEIKDLIPDYQKFNPSFLFSVVKSKFRTELKSLIFNTFLLLEFKEFILIHASIKLKNEIFKLVQEETFSSWKNLKLSFVYFLVDGKFVKANKKQIENLIESLFWDFLFDEKIPPYSNWIPVILEELTSKNLLSDRFWDVLQTFTIQSQTEFSKQEISYFNFLVRSGYGDVLSNLQPVSKIKIDPHKLQFYIEVFYGAVWMHSFPNGHILHGNDPFSSTNYFNKIIKNEKSELLLHVISKFQHPQRPKLLFLFDEVSLRKLSRHILKNMNLKFSILDLESLPLNSNKKSKELIKNIHTVFIGQFMDQSSTIDSIDFAVRLVHSFLEESLLNFESIIDSNWLADLFENLNFSNSKIERFFERISLIYPEYEPVFFKRRKMVIKNLILKIEVGKKTISFYSGAKKFKIHKNSDDQFRLQNSVVLTEGKFEYLSLWVEWSKKRIPASSLEELVHLFFVRRLSKITSDSDFRTIVFYLFFEKIIQKAKVDHSMLEQLFSFSKLYSRIPFAHIKGLTPHQKIAWISSWKQENGSMALKKPEPYSFHSINAFYSNLYNSLVWDKKNEFQFLRQFPEILKNASLETVFETRLEPQTISLLVKVKRREDWIQYFSNQSFSWLNLIGEEIFIQLWIKEFFSIAPSKELELFIFYFSKASINPPKGDLAKDFFTRFMSLIHATPALRKVAGENSELLYRFLNLNPSLSQLLSFSNFMESSENVEVFLVLGTFLKSGILPRGIHHIQDFGNFLMNQNSKEKSQIKYLIHNQLNSNRSRLNFIKLSSHLKESWYFNLIHEGLSKDINFFSKTIKSVYGIDLFKVLNCDSEKDKIIYISQLWTQRNPTISSPDVLIQSIFEDLILSFNNHEKKRLLDLGIKNKLIKKYIYSSSSLKSIILKSNPKYPNGKNTIQISAPFLESNYEDGIQIENAGLVLFWPFLGRFFKTLEWLENSDFKDESFRERSIQLLQFLAIGDVHFDDWDLTLNKILCGGTPDLVVNSFFTPEQEEVELIDKLLQGTIYNWEKLRGTKPETFRETFVKRKGVLYWKENRWELVIEKKAYDVLLDTLPWNISMINLSWMKSRITVQWN